MKKYNIILVLLLLSCQLGFSQNTDSTKIDIFMTKTQLSAIDLNINFISSFAVTPNRYIFLSSETALYVLGREGIAPVTSTSQQTISSFTITPDGNLYAILDKKLYRLDSANDFQGIIDLPDDKMNLSSGKNALYIYNSKITSEKNKYSIYQLFSTNNYQKIIETPAPINAVIEVEKDIVFSSESKLYCIDIENKAYREIAYLQNQDEKIISIAMDYFTQSLYFASPAAVFRMKDGKVDCVNDQFGGLLQCDEVGLTIFNPAERSIVRIRNNALFSTTSQNTKPQREQTVPVSVLPPVSKPDKSKSSTVQSPSAKQTVTYDAPTLLISTSGEKYEVQAGYYFVGIVSIDGKIEHGHLYNSNKELVKTFFVKE
jgi:hypothetical protein